MTAHNQLEKQLKVSGAGALLGGLVGLIVGIFSALTNGASGLLVWVVVVAVGALGGHRFEGWWLERHPTKESEAPAILSMYGAGAGVLLSFGLQALFRADGTTFLIWMFLWILICASVGHGAGKWYTEPRRRKGFWKSSVAFAAPATGPRRPKVRFAADVEERFGSLDPKVYESVPKRTVKCMLMAKGQI